MCKAIQTSKTWVFFAAATAAQRLIQPDSGNQWQLMCTFDLILLLILFMHYGPNNMGVALLAPNCCSQVLFDSHPCNAGPRLN